MAKNVSLNARRHSDTNNSVEKARMKMAALCARSEQCEYDIRTKLLRSFDTKTCDEIVDFLKHHDFIDNKRYACALTSQKVRISRWGRLKIKLYLKSKRISQSDIDIALEGIDETEYIDTAIKLARAKAADLNLSVREDKMKLFRFLYQRGFESGIISRIIGNLSR